MSPPQLLLAALAAWPWLAAALARFPAAHRTLALLGAPLALLVAAQPFAALGPLRTDPLSALLLPVPLLVAGTAALAPGTTRQGAGLQALAGAAALSLLAGEPLLLWLGLALLLAAALLLLPRPGPALATPAAGLLLVLLALAAAPLPEPRLRGLAALLLLPGLAALAGLAPLQGWLQRALAEATPPAAAALAGMLPLAALVGFCRLRAGMMVAAAPPVPGFGPPAPPVPDLLPAGLLVLGLLSLLLGAAALWSRPSGRAALGWWSLAVSGAAGSALFLGGAAGDAAALLLLAGAALLQAPLRLALAARPRTLALAAFAALGLLPPFAPFNGAALLLTAAAGRAPGLAVLLAALLLVATAGLLRRAPGAVAGAPGEAAMPPLVAGALALHLGLSLLLALGLAPGLRAAAALLR